MLLAALAIGLESGFREPILYRQTRVGRHDRPFEILKFRTMRVGAGGFTQPNDSRITRVGRFLREIRIDELPQLVNVLCGEMSLVGPRPEQPHYVAELRAAIPFYGLRGIWANPASPAGRRSAIPTPTPNRVRERNCATTCTT